MEAMKKKRQKLVAVQVAAAVEGEGAGAPAIVPVEGGSIEELLAAWRVAQIQPLGPLPAAGAPGTGGSRGAEGGGERRYLALLLLEEITAEDGQGRLGFGAT
jgi:hypothetical protein